MQTHVHNMHNVRRSITVSDEYENRFWTAILYYTNNDDDDNDVENNIT